MSGFVQGTDGRRPKRSRDLQAGEAGIKIIAAQSPGFGEFRGGVLSLAFEAIGRGEIEVDDWLSRIGVAGLFEPDDRVVNTRL